MLEYLNRYNQYKEVLIKARSDVRELFEYIENELGFLEAPASHSFHSSFRGGLCAHSVNVTSLALKLRKTLDRAKELISVPSIILVGLTHDVGKCGTKGRPYYKEKYRGYEYNKTNPPVAMPHSVRSLYIVSHFVSLSSWEAQAIAGHDGQYILANEEIKNKENPLTILIHHADLWSAFVDEGSAAGVPDEIWLPPVKVVRESDEDSRSGSSAE